MNVLLCCVVVLCCCVVLVWVPQGSQKRFAESFAEEAKMQAGKLDRTAAMVSKIVLGKQISKEHVPKLLAVIGKQMAEAESLKKTGVCNFDLTIPSDPKRRRRSDK